MNKLRQDGWTKDDDILLAEIVLSHIRSGKTQLDAFKLASERLARTPAACGFRWNATVRQQYEDAIYLAKNSRKRTNKSEINDHDYTVRHQRDGSIDSVIALLNELKNQAHQKETFEENENIHKLLEEENKLLKKEIERYQEAWKEMNHVWEWINNEK